MIGPLESAVEQRDWGIQLHDSLKSAMQVDGGIWHACIHPSRHWIYYKCMCKSTAIGSQFGFMTDDNIWWSNRDLLNYICFLNSHVVCSMFECKPAWIIGQNLAIQFLSVVYVHYTHWWHHPMHKWDWEMFKNMQQIFFMWDFFECSCCNSDCIAKLGHWSKVPLVCLESYIELICSILKSLRYT